MSVPKNYLLYTNIFIHIFLLCSCREASNKDGSDTQEYRFGLHLKEGSRYYYTLVNETTTQLEAGGRKSRTGNNAEVGLLYEVVTDSASHMAVKITYDKLRVVLMPAEGVEQEFDASDSIYVNDPVIKMLKTIKGSSMMISLDPSGGFLNVDGGQEIYQKVIAGLNVPDESMKKQLQEQLSKLAGPNFVKANLEHGFKLLPDSTIWEGSKWRNDLLQAGDISFTGEAEYELVSLKKDVATIKESSSMINDKNSKVAIAGLQVASALEGSQDGRYEIDINTGLLVNGKSQAIVEGLIQVMGQEIPVRVRTTKTVALKKL